MRYETNIAYHLGYVLDQNKCWWWGGKSFYLNLLLSKNSKEILKLQVSDSFNKEEK